MINNQQPLVIQYVPIIIVVQLHRGASVIPHILHSLGVRDWIRALVQHVLDMAGVQGWIHFGVQAVHQLDTVGSSYAVSAEQGNNSRGVDANPGKSIKNNSDALIVVRQVLFKYFCSAFSSISSSCFEWNIWPSKLYEKLNEH